MHLQASLHHHANYLQWRRKSSRWRTTSCLTASSFRHRSWPQLRRSLSAVVVAWFGWHGRSSAASARDGARSWEKATSLPRDRATPGWTPSPLVSCGLPHEPCIDPGVAQALSRSRQTGSAFASRSFRPIEMSSQRRMRGAVHAVAQNEAHSNCHRRRQEQAPVGFQHGPAPTTHSGL